MKLKRFCLLIIFSLFCISLSGCGKATVEAGEHVTDSSILNEGSFSEKVIDTSYIKDAFLCEAFNITDNGYGYILSEYNDVDFTQSYFYCSFDENGKTGFSGALDIPVTSKDNKVVFSNICKDLTFYPYDLDLTDGFLLYKDFDIKKNGDFSAICEIYSTISGYDTFFYNLYKVEWGADGKCRTISEIQQSDVDYTESVFVISNDNNIYSKDPSGISVVDENGNILSTYFNCINSDVRARGYDAIAIRDASHFSCIYRDIDGNPVLACFTANTSNSGKNAILVACSGMSESMMDLIVDYNTSNKDYRIAVKDYTLLAASGTEEEAWALLKADIEAGFVPDIIVNSAGFDTSFVSSLSAAGSLVNFKSLIKNDKELKNTEFTDNATSLFYTDDVFCLVPAYEYRTVVGNAETLGESEGWNRDAFLEAVGSAAGKESLFDLDTKDSFMMRVLAFDGNELVDKTTKTASFNSQEFIQFLELAGKLPADDSSAYELQYSSANKGQAMLLDATCLGLGDFHLASMMAVSGEYADLGFPGLNQPGSGVINATDSYMIMSDSAAANECWSILKNTLLNDYQTMVNSGIPVTKSGYTVWYTTREISEQNSTNYWFNLNGVEYMVTSPGDDVAALVDSHLNNCTKLEFSDYDIQQIVLEYADQYFAGQITSAEAAQKIDEEVEAYLNS